jgi:hypothetical protein
MYEHEVLWYGWRMLEDLVASMTHPISMEEVMLRVEVPNWDLRGKTHDWRNHVSPVLRHMWPDISVETRMVAVIMAEEAASKEEWE